MAATGIFIHFMRSTGTIFHALIQYWNHIINIAAVDNNEVFDKKAVSWIPTTMQNPGG